jgi:glycogen operon protein
MSDPQLHTPQPGFSYPIGATVHPDGVNFSVYARRALAIDLLLFDRTDAASPARVITLDPKVNRTYDYWHVFVPGIGPGQAYAYRAHGPYRPEAGLRFDRDKVLLDPYGRSVAMPRECNRDAAINPGDNAATALKSVVIDPRVYDWEGDRPLRRPYAETIIYEMHVRGFTRHPSSGVAPERRGTYAGLVEKIPYLQALGITAVELLPVFQFDPCDAPRGRVNYWGYSPISFFAPHLQYSVSCDPLQAVDEFRAMVKALHRSGIEVILDVVYNHTAEGSHIGPTFCYRGLANDDYYILDTNPALYKNYSGTGNTLNGNNTIVRRMILDSLRYWVREMHVDGFRFDLASILSRDEHGVPMLNPPILWDIEKDPVLAGTKLIAEAWDAGGLYQVGNFVGDHWKEWNGRFRDDVRAFVKSDPGMTKAVASRFFASPDIYGHKTREPEQSVNFVTCHDGFTLNDLVSYNSKHNLANGEQNRDGENHNLSWNCGYEGPTDDPAIERLRQRQIKNLLTITLLALGVPMLSMGDEVRRTQLGNNNAYCQDNEVSWFDWTRLETHGDILRFVRQLTRLRLHLDAVVEGPHHLNLWQLLHSTRVQWHGIKLNQPDTSYTSHSLALTAWGRWAVFHLIFNAYWEPLTFDVPALPPVAHSDWRRIIDTSLDSPLDFCEFPEAPTISKRIYRVEARSVVVLACRRMDDGG